MPKAGRLYWPLLSAGLFAATLFALSRGVTIDTWDGVQAAKNALLAAGVRTPTPWGGLEVSRPPLGWLLASPVVAWSYAAGGPAAALRTFQCLMIVAVAGLLLVSHRFFLRVVSARAAAAALIAMTLSPLLLEYTPFISMDLLSPLALLPFLWAACRYDERPGPARYAVLFAAYVAAFLTKYHLGLLVVVPLAYPLVDPRRRGAGARLRAFALNPVWLMPALCWLAGLLVWGLLSSRHRGLGVLEAAAQAQRFLLHDMVDNVGARASGARAMIEPRSRLFYPRMFLYELGWLSAPLAGLGVISWCRSGDALRLHAALALAAIVGFFAFLFYRPYAHYLFAAFPLVYAALAQGIDEAWPRVKRPYRAAALAAFALLLPWRHAADALNYLANNPATHTRAVERLAAAVAETASPDECVGWEDGELILPLSGMPYEPAPLLVGRSTFAFFASRRMAAPPEEGGGTDCRQAAVIVPRDFRQGDRKPPRWEGPTLARVYRLPDRALAAEVTAD